MVCLAVSFVVYLLVYCLDWCGFTVFVVLLFIVWLLGGFVDFGFGLMVFDCLV